ncbi:MAG: exodeoxyribonuclease VII large subunit [Clostridia bacterium]|nr:exodeoxyribonuclease VII large subunit [Clostridia bacterium]
MIISVSQFNNFVKGVLDSESMLYNVSVKGEVVNLKDSYDCYYFSLSDGSALLDCFIYKTSIKIPLTNGIEVIASGNPNFYVAGGRFTYVVRKIELVNAIGTQQLKLLALKERLEKEGCFDLANKKPVPNNCTRIGVISSVKGAVITDIEQVVKRRNPNVDIYLYPAKVQGEGSWREVVNGLEFFSNYDVDVVIVARGGGSDEDLSCFNTEQVVRAVNRCTKPTVSAIGHGINYTLCDYACDLRVATPSQSAEVVTIDVREQKKTVVQLLRRMYALSSARIVNTKQEIMLRLYAMYNSCCTSQSRVTIKYNNLTARLDNCSILKQYHKGLGYISSNGNKITTVNQLSAGNTLDIDLIDGRVSTTVNLITKR